jgi:hypothetical protein
MNGVNYPLAALLNESIAAAHDKILDRLIIKHLTENGSVTIEEAEFYNRITKQILTESSHLFVPEVSEIEETLMAINEAEIKVLMDPETGEKYVYNMETGELVPAADDMEAPESEEDDLEDAGDDLETDEGNLEAAEDVSAGDNFAESTEAAEDDKTKENLEENESAEDDKTKEKTEELTENELLINKLLSTVTSL